MMVLSAVTMLSLTSAGTVHSGDFVTIGEPIEATPPVPSVSSVGESEHRVSTYIDFEMIH